MTSHSLQPSTVHANFALQRSYPHSPDRVFNAFADPDLLARWFANGAHHTAEDFKSDFRTGGSTHYKFRMHEGTPIAGAVLTNDQMYLDIVPNQRIVLAAIMSLDGRHISASLNTFEFFPREGRTELICTCQEAFFEGADGPEMRKGGWEALLTRLGETLGK